MRFNHLMGRIGYIYKVLKKNWKDKFFWKSLFIYYVVANYYKLKRNEGVHVMNEDWDNLIILDCCRYDLFKEVTGINCDYRISRGSSTPEFLLENFSGRKFNDTIYITANPQVDKYVKDSFFKVVSVWKTDWDLELNTVLPERVVKRAIEVEEKYPDKRLIIHFLQPHIPFIKDPKLNKLGYGDKSTFHVIKKGDQSKIGKIPCNPWKEVGRGNIDLKTVYNAYKRNLEAVIPHAFKLAKKLTGKTVITSDHGQALNEWVFPFPIKVLDHPSYVHIPALIKVPWLIIEGKERKKIREADEKQKLKEQIRKLMEQERL